MRTKNDRVKVSVVKEAIPHAVSFLQICLMRDLGAAVRKPVVPPPRTPDILAREIQVLRWREHEHLTFRQITARLGYSGADPARKIYARACRRRRSGYPMPPPPRSQKPPI
jgi:hypothetical protein